MIVSIRNLKPGMKLKKPAETDTGMTVVSEGTVLTESIIQKLINMNIKTIFVEGGKKLDKPKETALSEAEDRFSKSIDEPYMKGIKKLYLNHIEELYKDQ